MIKFFGMGFLSEGFYCLFCVSHEISSAFKSKKVAICRCWQKNWGSSYLKQFTQKHQKVCQLYEDSSIIMFWF